MDWLRIRTKGLEIVLPAAQTHHPAHPFCGRSTDPFNPASRWLSHHTSRLAFQHSRGYHYGLVFRFPLLSTRGYSPDAVTFSYWPSSAGQVEDFHLAVKVRFQAHECGDSSPLFVRNKLAWVAP